MNEFKPDSDNDQRLINFIEDEIQVIDENIIRQSRTHFNSAAMTKSSLNQNLFKKMRLSQFVVFSVLLLAIICLLTGIIYILYRNRKKY